MSILVAPRKAAYECLRNPDASTREALARKLGPDVRSKTIAVWFQNRRSKSRTKDREAILPERLHLRGRLFPSNRVTYDEKVAQLNVVAYRNLVHDDNR